MLRNAWGQRWKNKQFKGKTSKTCTDSSLHTLLWSDSKLALFCYSRLDKGTIFKAACLTKEACGLSHMDAIHFGTSVLAQNVKKKINILETK